MKSFEEYFIMEEKLTTKDRDKLSDDDYGIIIKDKDGNVTERAYPLNDAKHVEAAARMYPFAKRKYDREIVAELRRKIIAKAKEYNVPDSKIQSVIDDNPGGKVKAVKESVAPEDDTTGTSEFDEYNVNEPDDCYVESDVFITEADKAFMRELQKKNDQIPLMELNKYGKKLIHYFNHGRSRTLVVNIKVSPNNHIERRCDEYYNSLIKAIDKFANDIEYGQLQPIKWYKYDKLVKTLFHSIGINYNKDRVLGEHTPGRLYFEEREYKKYKYDPNTDVLVHISNQKNLTSLKPTHCSRDGVTYPRPRIYSFLEKRSNLSSLRGNEYGDNIYVIDINKSFDVYHDMEYGKRYEEEKDKYGKPIFINTVKPLRVIPVEQILNNKQIAESFIIESKNDSIHMRPATKADTDRMYRWEMESIDKELQKDPKVQKAIREDVEQSIKDTQMIMDGKVTIGMFTACMIDDGEWRYIGEIYLMPSYRGRGIGSGILRKEIEQYPKIRLQVATSNDKAIKLYKSLGFKIVKENKKQKMYLMEYTRDAVQESKTNIPMKKVSILYKRWCVDNGEQYEKIARFWDIVERYENCDYLQGYGTAWTSDNGGYFTYGIIFKKGTIPNDLVYAVKREFPGMKVSNTYSVPSKYDYTFNGKTKDIDTLYDKIWSKGPLAYELEECRSDGTCSIHVIYKADITQESVIQNIKNKTSIFEKDLVYHISPEGTLDGQVFKPRVPEYLDKYDPTKPKFEDAEQPRVCFSPSIEGCLNAILVNLGRWKTADKLRDWYVYIPEKPLKEYKHRTTKQLVNEKKVYDANLTKEIWIEEPVRLKQYGVIRIDSVTDKSKRKTVPTTNGETEKRNYYDFKWHWLIKPKVLKDVKYDYSPKEVCKDMVDTLSDYKYGIPENGRIVDGSDHDYDTKWKLQSPEEFEKNKGGICYDYVEFEEGYLDAYGIKCKKYFISTDLPGHDTHTFILVDDGHGGFIYPESSFKVLEGTHEVKNLDHACVKVADGFWKINDNLKKVKPESNPNIKKPLKTFKCYLWEYTGHPPYGSNIATCIKYYSKGEPIKEWTQIEPISGEPKSDKAKALQEFVTHFRGGI